MSTNCIRCGRAAARVGPSLLCAPCQEQAGRAETIAALLRIQGALQRALVLLTDLHGIPGAVVPVAGRPAGAWNIEGARELISAALRDVQCGLQNAEETSVL